MHSDHDGRHLNETIYPNPNPLDKEPMNVAKRVRHDRKQIFLLGGIIGKLKNKKTVHPRAMLIYRIKRLNC